MRLILVSKITLTVRTTMAIVHHRSLRWRWRSEFDGYVLLIEPMMSGVVLIEPMMSKSHHPVCAPLLDGYFVVPIDALLFREQSVVRTVYNRVIFLKASCLLF